jgi:hypothetical protein
VFESGSEANDDGPTLEWLRAAVQDAHVSFLIGAGTPSRLFSPLGDIEEALTGIEASAGPRSAREIARASVQAMFFDTVISPNVGLTSGAPEAMPVLRSYARFGQALNRLLLARRSSLLAKQISLFTTNVDLAFEVSFERLGIALNDGFAGRFRPVYDPGGFGTVRLRSSPRYGHRSEVPTFDLYKLHGSVGWQWAATESASPEIVFDRDLADVRAVAEALRPIRRELIPLKDPASLRAAEIVEAASALEPPKDLAAFVRAYRRLVIVNPEKTKFATTVLTETYYELIRRFANEMERESSVLFVHGFSFRDEHLRKIVVRAARTNPTLQVVIFCFSPADRTKYGDLIPDLDVPNRNIGYVVPPAGQSLDLDGLVDRFLLPMSSELPGRVDVADAAYGAVSEDPQGA